MTPTWAKRIQAAQHEKAIKFGDGLLARVPFGSELFDVGLTCRDCGCDRGQLHVSVCCVEQCPRCNGQRLSCGCTRAVLECVETPGGRIRMVYGAD